MNQHDAEGTRHAAERVYVHESVETEFLDRYMAAVRALPPADPRLETTVISPKASEREQARAERIIADSVAAGAKLLLGGDRARNRSLPAGSFWLNPAVLVDVDESTAAVREETFGPVSPVSPFDDWGTLVERVNASRFGLSAYVHMADLSEAYRASGELRYGEVHVNRVGPEEVNGFHIGFRESGLGGDDGPFGLDQYFQRQTTYVRHGLAR